MHYAIVMKHGVAAETRIDPGEKESNGMVHERYGRLWQPNDNNDNDDARCTRVNQDG